MFLQKHNKFLFKAHFAVMPLLVSDVSVVEKEHGNDLPFRQRRAQRFCFHGRWRRYMAITFSASLRNRLTAIFCAEDQMDGVLRVAMWHGFSSGEAFYLWPRRWRSTTYFCAPTASAVG
jgi:hypothetical protein